MKSPESLELEALLRGEHANPHHFLGIHKVGQRYVVRGIFVNAKQCFICKLSGEVLAKMHKIAETMYEAFLPAFVQYQFKVVYGEHEERFVRDPYVFSPTLTAEDLYLFNPDNEISIANGTNGYTPKANISIMAGDLAFLSAYLAKNADYVLVARMPDLNFMKGRREVFGLDCQPIIWEKAQLLS